MRFPRFRIRTLMIAVAVVASVLGMYALARERGRRLQQAKLHSDAENTKRDQEAMWAQIATALEGEKAQFERDKELPDHARLMPIKWYENNIREISSQLPGVIKERTDSAVDAARETALKHHYERAAHYPWLPIPPEPK